MKNGKRLIQEFPYVPMRKIRLNQSETDRVFFYLVKCFTIAGLLLIGMVYFYTHYSEVLMSIFDFVDGWKWTPVVVGVFGLAFSFYLSRRFQ